MEPVHSLLLRAEAELGEEDCAGVSAWQVETRRPEGALREAMLARHAGDVVSIDDVADGKQTLAVVDGPRGLRGPGGEERRGFVTGRVSSGHRRLCW